MTRRVARFVLPVLAALALAVCGCNRNGMSKFIEKIEDLKGLRCGVILGSVFQDAIERLQPDLEFHSFNNTPSAVDALRIGKVDVVPIDGVIGRQLAARYPKDFRVAFLFGDNPYGYFYRKGSPLKATSVVGYIAINDLTKASDLVRSRTYESFFPILTTAFIYFAVAWLLAFALERFGRRFDPARGRREVAA